MHMPYECRLAPVVHSEAIQAQIDPHCWQMLKYLLQKTNS